MTLAELCDSLVLAHVQYSSRSLIELIVGKVILQARDEGFNADQCIRLIETSEAAAAQYVAATIHERN